MLSERNRIWLCVQSVRLCVVIHILAYVYVNASTQFLNCLLICVPAESNVWESSMTNFAKHNKSKKNHQQQINQKRGHINTLTQTYVQQFRLSGEGVELSYMIRSNQLICLQAITQLVQLL